MTEPETAPVATKRTVERIRRDRHVQAACAVDSVPLLAARVTDMLWWGRRIAVAQRWIDTDSPIEMATGLIVDPEMDDRAVRLTVTEQQYAHFAVYLAPGILNGFGFGAYASDRNLTEDQVWTRWHADDRRDITIVELVGGGPSDGGPGKDDHIRIRYWNHDRVGREFMVAFDTSHYYQVWHEREDRGWTLGGKSTTVDYCKQFAQVGDYRVRCSYPLAGDACAGADDHVEPDGEPADPPSTARLVIRERRQRPAEASESL